MHIYIYPVLAIPYSLFPIGVVLLLPIAAAIASGGRRGAAPRQQGRDARAPRGRRAVSAAGLGAQKNIYTNIPKMWIYIYICIYTY